jgi:hypothetical protein
MRGCGRIERPAFPAPSEFQMRFKRCKTRANHAARSRRCGCFVVVNRNARVCLGIVCDVIARSERDEAIQLFVWYVGSMDCFASVRNDGANLIVRALSLRTVQPHRRSSSLPLAGRVARSAGWGYLRTHETAPPVTSFAPLTMCHPRASFARLDPTEVGGIRKSEFRSSRPHNWEG